ncbi:histone-lysine N-methyltransferase SMYD3 [Sardina pilchardus]|uniref:histone-lysine N-methyltransferase SMYD3 n=1 Tax=Sardina pilchardus TaxID=27697 RepID=UPI002E155468
MALKIERFVSVGKGNGLRAVHKIKAGELLYRASPLACCVSKKHLATACHNCFTRAESLLRCSRCKTARYCNATCQKEAWSKHKGECRRLKNLHPRIPPDSVCLAARILSSMLSISHRASEELYTLQEHQSHLTDMPEEKQMGLMQLCSALQLFIQANDQSADPFPAPDLDLLNLLGQVTCNCFTISDGELQEVGVGLYPSMSLLNHDCQPNCVMMFEGKTLYLRAITDIQPQEELTISYTDAMAPSVERRSQLEEQYHFHCQCQRCSTADKDADMLAGAEEVWGKLKEALPSLERLQLDQKWTELLSAGQALLEGHAGAVPDTNVYLLQLLDLLLDACISLGQYDTALEFGTRTLQPYRLYYTDPHPACGIQLMRVGKLQHLLGRVEEASESFRQAYDILKVTHGTEHTLTNELQEKLLECQADLGRD